MTENTLPEEIVKQIGEDADKFAFQVPYNGTNEFYNQDEYNGYTAGAKVWAEKYWQEKQSAEALKEKAEKYRQALIEIYSIDHEICTSDYTAFMKCKGIVGDAISELNNKEGK